MKKTPGDIIILHQCTKNDDHVVCCSWYVENDIVIVSLCNVIVIFHFGIFFDLYPPYSLKNQNFKNKKKNAWRYLHKCTKNHDRWYAILFLRYGAWQM